MNMYTFMFHVHIYTLKCENIRSAMIITKLEKRHVNTFFLLHACQSQVK